MGIKARQALPHLMDTEINKEILHDSCPGMVFRPLFGGWMEALWDFGWTRPHLQVPARSQKGALYLIIPAIMFCGP